MKRISQLKDEAIAALSGNWGKAALATLGLLVVSIAFSMVFQLMSGTNILDYYEALFTNDTAALMEAMGGNIYVTILQVLGGILFTMPLGIGVYNSFRVLFESKGADNAIFRNFFKLAFGKHYLHSSGLFMRRNTDCIDTCSGHNNPGIGRISITEWCSCRHSDYCSTCILHLDWYYVLYDQFYHS